MRPDTAASTPDNRSADGTLPVHQKEDGLVINDEKNGTTNEKGTMNKRSRFPWSRPGSRGKESTMSDSGSENEKSAVPVSKEEQLPPVSFFEMFRCVHFSIESKLLVINLHRPV